MLAGTSTLDAANAARAEGVGTLVKDARRVVFAVVVETDGAARVAHGILE